MKRLFILVLAAAGLSACELYTGDVNYETETDLQRYTVDAFSGYVMMPVLMADLAVEFDAYMALSDEEKAENFKFYGSIRNPEENVYVIEDDRTLCAIKTDGKSLWDENARWTFQSFSILTSLNGVGDLYCIASEPMVLESYPAPAGDDADRLFSIMMGDYPIGLELSYDESGETKWNAGTQGVINDTDGYMAEYVTGTGGVSVTKRYNEGLYCYEYICSGDFLVSVFRNGEPVDMCKAIFRPGLRPDYVSGK